MVAPTGNIEELVLKLPIAERARLALRLIESLDDEAELAAVEQDWLVEIDARVREIDAGTVTARPSSAVFAAARAALHAC